VNTPNAQNPDKAGPQPGSATLRRMSYVLLAGNLFCLVVMFGPDSNYLSANAKLEIPFIESTISAKLFLIFFPIFLISVNLYAQLLINALMRSDAAASGAAEKTGALPSVDVSGSPLVSLFIFYIITPLTLVAMSWKSLPRPEASFLIPVTVLFATGLFFLRMWQVRRNRKLSHYMLGAWLGVNLVFLSLYYVQHNLFHGKLRSLRSVDMVMAELEKSDFRNVHLSNARMDYIVLEAANLEQANLFFAQLKNANLMYTILRQAILDHAFLEEAKLDHADLRDATLIHASLPGAQLKKADMSNANLYFADLVKSDLSGANLTDAKVQKGVLIRSNLHMANLVEADFSNASLNYADLSQADAASVILNMANLANANLEKAKLDSAIARGTKFDGAQLDEADLKKADLTCATLIGADLDEADLQDAILVNVDFKNTNLYRANLMFADLRGATHLTCKQLQIARNWEFAIRDHTLKCDNTLPEIMDYKDDDLPNCSSIRLEILAGLPEYE
jgi:uncharacterized protein YjbI with pentapeptide repeats